MSTGDRFFGFCLIQRKTLARLLAETAMGDAALLARIADLEARVDALENP